MWARWKRCPFVCLSLLVNITYVSIILILNSGVLVAMESTEVLELGF